MPPLMKIGSAPKASPGGGFFRYVFLGGGVAISVLLFLFHVVTHHHSVEETHDHSHLGAPVLAHPAARAPSAELQSAAEARKRETHRLTGSSWEGLREGSVNRTAGPFINLPGAVGGVRFTYADILPVPDPTNYPPTEARHLSVVFLKYIRTFNSMDKCRCRNHDCFFFK